MDHPLQLNQPPGRAALLPPLLLLCCCGGGSDELPHDTLVRGCLARNACGVRPYPGLADCVSDYYEQQLYYALGAVYAKAYRCAAAVKGSCDAISQCFGVPRGVPRCERSFVGSCDGARALSCDLISGQSYSEDCALAGLGCVVPSADSFMARCSSGTCDSSFRPRCEGARLQTCGGGLIEVVDCAARGATCLEGTSSCVGSGESCEPSSGPRCEGQTAVRCLGGRISRQDCGARPFLQRCQDGACVAAGGDCGGEVDRCAGAQLESCLEGRWQRFDCAAMGFLGCQPSQTGAACGAPN